MHPVIRLKRWSPPPPTHTTTPPRRVPPAASAQDKVNKALKLKLQRKAGKGGATHAVDEEKQVAGPPRRWNDYTVSTLIMSLTRNPNPKP